jgi:hypothetical protein
MHLASTYQPDMFFPDFHDCGFDSTSLRSRELLAWLYNESPIKDTVVMGDRLGTDANCQHSDYFTCQGARVCVRVSVCVSVCASVCLCVSFVRLFCVPLL